MAESWMKRGWIWAVLVAALSAPLAWVVTDRLERDDDFCNACHLAPGRPLHMELRRGFDAVPARSLAGFHGAASLPEHDDRAFRCIDCHGGASFPGRARVKVLAALDGFWYATGHFDEPTQMEWPLWDEDCRKCHDRFAESKAEAWESPRFHQLAVHNVELGVDCVECHLVHEPGGQPEHAFLHASRVRTQCARCHTDFEEGTE